MSRCLTQESKFLVLNKKSAWDRGLAVNIDVGDRGLKIRQRFEYVFDQENEIEVLSDTFEVTDFAVTECGQLYILDSATPGIWLYDPNQKRIERIDCIGPLFVKPTTIAYSSGIVYVGDPETDTRVFGLAERNWQIVAAIGPSPANETIRLPQPFAPIDLAIDGDGNLFALDQGANAILKFDQRLQLVNVIGQTELSGKQPARIAISAKGLLYVLDAKDNRVLKFDSRNADTVDGNFIDFEALKSAGVLPKQFVPGGLAVDTDGNLFVGDARNTAPAGEDDRFLHRFDADRKYLGIVEDSRGAANEIAIDRDNSIFIFRREAKNKITQLRRQPSFGLLEGTPLIQGIYFSKALDSYDAGTIWHKLSAVVTRPANAQIQISFLAADKKQMKVGPSDQDLDDFIAESVDAVDIQARLANLDALNWSRPVVNSDDALISAEGRYLWTRILLIGNERESPALHSLRVDFPRTSYLRYLPAIYSEDDAGRDLLERFLSLFETLFAGLEARTDRISSYFDPDSLNVPGDFLRWLSMWLAVSVDNSWDDEKLRKLIKRASEIYKRRGTRAAIREMIEIFTGKSPLIVEHHQLSCRPWCDNMSPNDADELTKLYRQLYGEDPFCFCVLLQPFSVKTQETYNAVRRIIDAEKPAHTCAGLLALQPWVQLDAHTYLGVNTYLSEPSARLDFGSTIPRDTVLNDRNDAGQLENQSRIDLDMKLI